jgi:hypothetical protein
MYLGWPAAGAALCRERVKENKGMATYGSCKYLYMRRARTCLLELEHLVDWVDFDLTSHYNQSTKQIKAWN